jgi:hypothetical protein
MEEEIMLLPPLLLLPLPFFYFSISWHAWGW